ncbi:Transposase IS4 [Popillia japonica]|uniref:Transposase IS4 n=1 Tax=Popillia japonica TaxID=7064 RepID=A0AAW1MD77_POPJA
MEDLGIRFARIALAELLNWRSTILPYCGRHECKQFIHGKPIRYGNKLWVGTTKLDYINWFEPYKGALTNMDPTYAVEHYGEPYKGALTNMDPTYADYGVGAAVVPAYSDVLHMYKESQ